MLTGRLQLAADPSIKRPQKTLFVLRFGHATSRSARDAAAWTAGASWIPAPDATPEMRYRDPTQMGKVYLLPTGVERPVPGAGPHEMGPDADDPSLTLDVWRSASAVIPGELKNLLRNQEFVAGVGNAYSDEILHAARLLPTRKRGTLAPEEVDELYAAPRERRSPTRSRSCANASRPRSRPRSATSWPFTTGAGRRARAAVSGSPRPRPAASRRATAATASTDSPQADMR